MNKKERMLDIITIIALFLIMTVGIIAVSHRTDDINNGRITVVSDSEMDK